MGGRVGRHTGFLFPRAAIAGAAVAAVLVLAPGTASAGHVTCGQLVNKSIKLDSDLNSCANGLIVNASKITIDLNGHTIDGTGGGVGISNPGNFDRVRIEDGTVKEFGDGIVFGPQADRGRVTDLSVSANIDRGIEMMGTTHRVDDNIVSGNKFGINLRPGTVNSRVTDNAVSDSLAGGVGIWLFNADSNRVDRNSVTGAALHGILLQSSADNNRVDHNDSFDNTQVGIFVFTSDSNTVEDNALSSNGYGISLQGTAGQEGGQSDNPLCTIMPNLPGCVTPSTPDNPSDNNVLEDNESIGNDQDGLLVGSVTTGTLVDDNQTHENGRDGIHMDGPGTVANNTANTNTNIGIFAVGATDGGDNKAHGNGTADCMGVACS